MVRSGFRFLARVLAGGILVAGIGTVPLSLVLGRDAVVSWWIGAGISLGNCCWGTLLLLWGMERKNTAVLAAVTGGFLGRLAVAMSALWLLWGRTWIDGVVLALSIVGFYFVGMVVEIHFLQKHALGSGSRGGKEGRRGRAGLAESDPGTVGR